MRLGDAARNGDFITFRDAVRKRTFISGNAGRNVHFICNDTVRNRFFISDDAAKDGGFI